MKYEGKSSKLRIDLSVASQKKVAAPAGQSEGPAQPGPGRTQDRQP